MSIVSRFVTNVALATAVVVGAAVVSNSASAVTVNNSSFETLPSSPPDATQWSGCLGTGCYFTNVFSGSSFPDWVATGVSGQFQPGGTGNGYLNSLPFGPTVAYAENGGQISQFVGSAIAGTTYTLTVDLGFRLDRLNPGTAALVIGSNTFFATGTTNQNSGNWYDWTVTYTAGLADAGNPISIVLANSSTVQFAQGVWDNVSLSGTTSATPLPAALPLFASGLGALGLLGWRRKRKALAA